jgi:hypothetical protein
LYDVIISLIWILGVLFEVFFVEKYLPHHWIVLANRAFYGMALLKLSEALEQMFPSKEIKKYMIELKK